MQSLRNIAPNLRSATSALTEVMRSEVRLAKAEVKEASAKLGGHALRVGLFAAIALLGALPLVAALVIGLGICLGGMYWLSALIVSAVLIALGGGLTYREYSRIREEKIALLETRAILAQEKELLQKKIHQMSEMAKRRMA